MVPVIVLGKDPITPTELPPLQEITMNSDFPSACCMSVANPPKIVTDILEVIESEYQGVTVNNASMFICSSINGISDVYDFIASKLPDISIDDIQRHIVTYEFDDMIIFGLYS